MNIRTLYHKLLGIIVFLVVPNLAFAVYPCVDIKKEVSNDGGLTWYDANTEAEAVNVTSDALYKITVKRCDHDGLYNVLVNDSLLGVNQPLTDFPLSSWNKDLEIWEANFDAEAQSFTIPANGICQNYTGTIQNTATVTATGTYRQTQVADSDDAWIRCEPPTSGGGEGCTPGYWKQPQHFDSWPNGISPSTAYNTIFGRTITIRTQNGLVTNPTLLQALSALGGNINTAARHSTAAYLNAVSSGVSYDLTPEQVIDNLQESVDSSDFGTLIDALVGFNEQGCPLN